MTEEIKTLLMKIADLCSKASEEVEENAETIDILNLCDNLQDEIDTLLRKNCTC